MASCNSEPCTLIHCCQYWITAAPSQLSSYHSIGVCSVPLTLSSSHSIGVCSVPLTLSSSHSIGVLFGGQLSLYTESILGVEYTQYQTSRPLSVQNFQCQIVTSKFPW